MNAAMAGITRRFVDTALGHVHVVQAGPRTGVPIVLLHQTPRSIDEFAEVLPLLAARRHAIAIDTPGYGCSDRPARQPTVNDYAAAVVAVLDALGVQRAHCVGHHTGAIIAVELAAGWPQRVAGVGLSGPVYADGAGRAALAPHFRQWHPVPDGSHLQEKWLRFTTWTDAEPALLQRLVVDLFRAGETSEFGHFAILEYRMEDRLPMVSCPGLILYGRRDPFTTEATRRHFHRAFKPTHEVELDGGVFLPNEAPIGFAEAVLGFLT
jgi:pimeloyl-ACP methyl ester carboxylesterase